MQGPGHDQGPLHLLLACAWRPTQALRVGVAVAQACAPMNAVACLSPLGQARRAPLTSRLGIQTPLVLTADALIAIVGH